MELPAEPNNVDAIGIDQGPDAEPVEMFSEELYNELGQKLKAMADKNAKELVARCSQTDEVGADVRRSLRNAVKQQAALQEKRQHGIHKGAARFENFVACVSRVLDNYDFVADVVQDAGVPYANVGFQIIASLLKPARKKQDIDASVYAQLRQIGDAFPRVQILRKVYDRRLQRVFIQIDRGMLTWAHEASLYFTSGGRRFFSFLTGSPTADTHEKLMNLLLQTTTWSETLLHQSVSGLQQKADFHSRQLQEVKADLSVKSSELKTIRSSVQEQESILRGIKDEVFMNSAKLDDFKIQNQRMEVEIVTQSTKLDDLKNQAEHMEKQVAKLSDVNAEQLRQRDEEQYKRIQQILCSKTEAGVPEVAHLLEEISRTLKYRHRHRGAVHTRSWSFDALAARNEFSDWQSDSATKMLMLGTIEQPTTATNYSWISTGLLHYTENLLLHNKNDKADLVAFFTCHPNPWTFEDSSFDFVDIAANLAAQVLRADKSLLRRSEFRQLDESTVRKWRQDWCQFDTDRMFEYLTPLFDLATESRFLRIVIDRLDSCRDFQSDCTEVLAAFERLLKATKNTRLMLSVLLLPNDRQAIACERFLREHKKVVGGHASLRLKEGP